MDIAPTPSGRFSRWYVVATNYGQHYLAQSVLSKMWHTFFPLHLDRRGPEDRLGPLFPGYGFVEFSPDDDWTEICRTRGVYQLLGDPGRPRPLPIGAVEELIARTSHRYIVDDPGAQRVVTNLSPGARARVSDGPLRGWEGLCTLSTATRVRLLLELFGTPREVEFKRAAVIPL